MKANDNVLKEFLHEANSKRINVTRFAHNTLNTEQPNYEKIRKASQLLKRIAIEANNFKRSGVQSDLCVSKSLEKNKRHYGAIFNV